MRKAFLVRFLTSMFAVLIFVCGVSAQNTSDAQTKSQSKTQKISEKEEIPVLIKHLPDWENARNRANYILNTNDLRSVLGERPVFDSIDFAGGAEAVSAPYPQGILLIVEYPTPQASVDTDNKVKQKLSETGQSAGTFYRRIGNYNAFVFDAKNESAANNLLDQVKYEKEIQWLAGDPFAYRRAERAFVKMTSDLFVSTVIAIVGGLGLSILAGIIVGVVFFYLREQKRAAMTTFSDAGGMTRLNLDGLTPQMTTDRLLKD